MKDSQFVKKKTRKFIKKKPTVEAPKKPHSSLREKVKNLTPHFPSSIYHFPFISIRPLRQLVDKWRMEPEKWKIIKNLDLDLQLILIPAILLIILTILMQLNKNLYAQIAMIHTPVPQTNGDLHPYPLVTTNILPIISAKAAIATDVDSQIPLFSKNPDLRFSMASTTKIMTALVALDYYKPDTVLTVQSVGITGTVLGLVPGEPMKFLNLLYAMLLPSANDAAIAIADNYPGGQTAFVRAMNEKARQLHLTNTHFSDADGLDDDGDYTTVTDMSHLASTAIKNPLFAAITATKTKTINDSLLMHTYFLVNSNQLLGIDGVTGMKTGTTEGAGEVLVTSALLNSHRYIFVVMESTDRFVDTKTLLKFTKENVTYIYPI